MESFSARQRDVIRIILSGGRVTRPQVAVLLPQLVQYIFRNDATLRDELVQHWGTRLADILERLGSALLSGDRKALALFEVMVSRTKKDN